MDGNEEEPTQLSKHRQLPGSASFNYTAGAANIYDKYMLDIDGVMEALAVFHDWDEALLTAWTDSGIEAGLEILYDAIGVVRVHGWMEEGKEEWRNG